MHDSWQLTFARVWFAGKFSAAPGTAGSLAAIILAPCLFLPLPFLGKALFLAFLFWSGMHTSARAEEILACPDPPEVVIDEFVGQWFVCLPFSNLNFWELAAAFALFRLFDIAKPWPVHCCENLSGGLGIMADDLMAGLYAMLVLGLLLWIF